MGIPESHPSIIEAKRKGLIAPLPCEDVASPLKPKLVADEFGPNFGVWVIGVEVPSLSNSRDWRTRNRVTQAHRRAVSRALGKHLRAVVPFAEHFHRGEKLRVVLTRLGGKALDKFSNLPASLKYVEDAVALMLGADDGAANWLCECHQEPGGSCGVRIQLEAC